MKAFLKFDLRDAGEKEDFETALKAPAMRAALVEYAASLREVAKYSQDPAEAAAAVFWRTKFYEILEYNELDV